MDISFKIEKLSGVSSQKSASSVFTSRVSLDEDNVATLVSLISVWASQGEDAQVLLSDIFEIASRKLEGTQDGILGSVEASREATLDYLEAHKTEGAFAHVVFYKDAAYVVKSDKVGILVSKPPKISELDFESGSGPVEEGQIYLLATEKFLESFAPESFLKEQADIEEVVDELATEISAKDDSSRIAAAIVVVIDKGLQVKADRGSALADSASAAAQDEPALGKSADLERVPEDKATAESDKVKAQEESLDKTLGEEIESGKSRQAVAVKDHDDKQTDFLDGSGKESRAGLKSVPKSLLNAFFEEVKKIKRSDSLAILRLRRNIVVIALIFLIILSISAVFTIKNKRDQDIAARFDQHLVVATSKFGEAEALVELNKSRAREILIEADGEVSKALHLKPQDSKALDLKDKIAGKLSETENLSALKFSTLVEADSDSVSLSLSGKNLVGVTKDKIYEVDIDSKSIEEVGEIDSAKSVFSFDNSAFVLSEKGVYKHGLDAALASEEIIGDANQAFDIVVFAGNVYLLASGQIYKYVPVEDGYAPGANYLSGNEQFEMSSRFAIDGSVWVTNGSRVIQYLRGENQNFEISGLTSSNLVFGEIYTDAQSDNIYVIDVANSALLVIGKGGIYKSAYQSSDFGSAMALVVDEEGGKMYIAVGNKVLEADL